MNQRQSVAAARSVLLFVGVCLACVACKPGHQSAPAQPAWKVFTSDAGKFTASFPGIPKESTNVSTTPIGNIEVHAFIVELPSRAYGVSYNDFPSSVDTKSHIEQLFDGSEAAVLYDVTKGLGQIVAQRSMTVQNFPAREFEFKAGGKANFSGLVRMVLVGPRIYSMTTVFLRSEPHVAERKKFFDSFSIHEEQKTPESPPDTDGNLQNRA